MYYYGGYSGGYNTGSSCGCSNAMNYSYPSYGYGYGNYGYASNAAIVQVLFILLVIIIGTRLAA